MTDFEAALKVLTDGGVRFIVVGAYAAVAHGSSQVTRDLDICYERTAENMRKLASALAPYHPRLRGIDQKLPFVLDVQALAQGMNVMLQTDLGEIDLMGQLSGVGGFNNLLSGAQIVRLHQQEIHIASLDAVIKSKKAAGRPKDLNAIPELEALKDLQASRESSKDKIKSD
jgi:hypothetical protein